MTLIKRIYADGKNEKLKMKNDTAAQVIGQESCFKCHLVHTPAAMSQMRLSMK